MNILIILTCSNVLTIYGDVHAADRCACKSTSYYITLSRFCIANIITIPVWLHITHAAIQVT